MKTNRCTTLFYSMTQIVRRTSGMLCCIIALTCIISCSSSHHTSGHYHSVHTYQGANDQYGHQYHGDSLELFALQAIIIGAIYIIPPVLEAIGEAIDEIFVGIGLKEREPRY